MSDIQVIFFFFFGGKGSQNKTSYIIFLLCNYFI